MNRTGTITGAIVIATVIGVLPSIACAQLPRTPGGGPAAAPVPGTPVRSRAPFVGSWEGTWTMSDGPGHGRSVAVGMVFDADSAGRQYSGYTILPGNARAPHLKSVVAEGSMRWEQPNSGGGRWMYTARLVTPDSIEGTLILRDWPQGGGEEPKGTFGLARRGVGSGGSR